MRRTTKYIALWVGATALTVMLSWLGVRSVLHTAVFEQPTAVGAVRRTDGTPASSSASPTASASASIAPTGTPPAQSTGGRAVAGDPAIRSVEVRGGRAVFSVGGDSARLVSATPESGYRTEVSRNLGWIRVDFVSGQGWSSVIASWYRHKPTIEVYEQ